MNTRRGVGLDAAPENDILAIGNSSETTVEALLEQIKRIAAREPHARCSREEGPLGPVAAALNALSAQLSARRLKEEEAFGMRALMEQSPNSMFCCDVNARIRYINFTIPGLTVERVLGDDLFDWIAPESRENARSVTQRVLATGETGGFELKPLVEGGPEWFAARVGPIMVEDRIIGFTVILTDITDLKRTQVRLEQSNRELESFAYVASHDLQEPLRKIQTFGERLKKTSTGLSPEGHDYLERMQGAATRMRRLIDDLLAFSRVSAKGQPFTRVELATVANEVLDDLEDPIEQTGATVTLGDLPVLDADPTQMRQLLQNLVGNALKFRREETPPSVSITASVDAQRHRFTLVVADNGIGFDEKYRDRIFNVFQRLHGRGQYEGTGIGLAICRKIAERHGGVIEVRSTPDVGSSFHITLPLKQPMRR
ncbi:sensor histidine kinase [Melittangium boletus]|uniref:histidine kinase n=1 Tax=Melittangium boletus DSM 14713 TaxID=1294270 RepID=A0A250IQ90_9BACT|nr:ATP-binding protein [Melittangium boletus]ATB33412.1 two-component sensor histidine kinase [Melittangium boletus DSM 14713]